jgi:hypothetical protein
VQHHGQLLLPVCTGAPYRLQSLLIQNRSLTIQRRSLPLRRPARPSRRPRHLPLSAMPTVLTL